MSPAIPDTQLSRQIPREVLVSRGSFQSSRVVYSPEKTFSFADAPNRMVR